MQKGLIYCTGVEWYVYVIMKHWLGTGLMQHRSSTWCILSCLRRGSCTGIAVQHDSPEGNHSPLPPTELRTAFYRFVTNISLFFIIQILNKFQSHFAQHTISQPMQTESRSLSFCSWLHTFEGSRCTPLRYSFHFFQYVNKYNDDFLLDLKCKFLHVKHRIRLGEQCVTSHTIY